MKKPPQKQSPGASIRDRLPESYDHHAIEPAWQSAWQRMGVYTIDTTKPKKPYYNLMMFPYPSAEGLHVGNMYAFTGSDIFGRFKRMQGYDVFEPIGLDGFGIHSENFALKIGRHPMDHAQITEKNYYKQLQAIGAMFDWSRTVETYNPAYYTWTQWLFVQMFKHGLAYRAKASVNWCPSCKTVLADEQVIDGACERCGNTVGKRSLEQWFFRITAYAEKLLENISTLQWTEKVKTAQKQWIGKKEGVVIDYGVIDGEKKAIGQISCFTTRPDTNYGATFVVLAPEHPFVTQVTHLLEKNEADAIRNYLEQTKVTSDEERVAEGRKKTGVTTGLFCVNPLNGRLMPLYISDFVVMEVGTGAVVGVPGHDKRDFEFAQTFDLPVERVVSVDGSMSPISNKNEVYEEEGITINSEQLNGLRTPEAIKKIIGHIEKHGWGRQETSYHLRDWLISRQRYWGPPIPMIYCEHCAKQKKSWFTTDEANKTMNQLSDQVVRSHQGTDENISPHGHADARDSKGEMIDSMVGWYPVVESSLPVTLPKIDDYKPGDDGVAPLAKHKEFYETLCPGCGGAATRETDVSDTFLDSSWYFMRYPTVSTPHASRVPFDPDISKKWLPVDMYTGGAEHSVLHLMYSRFVTMALHDWGLVDFDEPFEKFFAHGLVIKDGSKMSKSKGNVVNPDEYIAAHGADALRMYLMFMGPFSQGGDFRDSAMEGIARWVGRIWRIARESMSYQPNDSSADIARALQNAIKKVGEDLEARRYNTALATMMEFTNVVQDHGGKLLLDELKDFLRILSPFAPHIAEELWQNVHGRDVHTVKREQSIFMQSWPVFDPAKLKVSEVTVIVQVNGKLRDSLLVPIEKAEDKEYIEEVARKSKASTYVSSGKVAKVVFVPKRLINFVITPA